MQPAPLTGGGLALGEITCRGWGPQASLIFFVYGCGEKIGLKSPKLHTQGPPGTARVALGSMPIPQNGQKLGNLDTSSPCLTPPWS